MNLTQVKIKSKKSIGVQPVYDLCVPNEHHYILDNGIVSHNSGFIYASSIVVALGKLNLKEDDDGNKTTTTNGIRANCKVIKTRYSKPFEKVQIKIPYEGGMNAYSGLTEFFEQKGILAKTGNKLEFIDPATGESLKLFRKQWDRNEGNSLDTVMTYFTENKRKLAVVDDQDAADEQDAVVSVDQDTNDDQGE